MFTDGTALTSAGLQLVLYTKLEMECPLKEQLMKRGGYCKNVFQSYHNIYDLYQTIKHSMLHNMCVCVCEDQSL